MGMAMQLDSTNLDYHHLLADIYLDYFRSRLALQTMERAVAIAPDNVPSLLKLSEIQLFLKMNQASLTSIDKVLRLDPQNALAFFFMGKNFEEMGDINRAINAFQESSELDPKMIDTWIKLGQLHASINGSLAGAFFDNAISLDSSSTVALNAKAEYLWDQDKPEEALSLYKTAILKDPMDEKSYYNAGLVFMELDSIDKAYHHFDMAVENAPLYIGAYFYRGYAAEMLGKNEQAKSDYQHVLRLAPDHASAQERLAGLK
ncbi:MAG: tetratricopeptide repeat protein [Saprospiraceae bacterium]